MSWESAYAARGLVMVNGEPRRIAAPRERFERRVRRSDGCWEWTGSTDKRGYGWFRYGGAFQAHRAAWLIYVGPIAPGLCVCHHCDNPRCVRIDHLFLGTHQDNMTDLKVKNAARKNSVEDLP